MGAHNDDQIDRGTWVNLDEPDDKTTATAGGEEEQNDVERQMSNAGKL